MGNWQDYDDVNETLSIIDNDKWRKGFYASSVNYLDLTWKEKVQCVNNLWRCVKDYRKGNVAHQQIYSRLLSQKRKRSVMADLPIFVASNDIRCFKDPAGRWEFVDIDMVTMAISSANSKFESYFANCDVDEKDGINGAFSAYMRQRNIIKDMTRYF